MLNYGYKRNTVLSFSKKILIYFPKEPKVVLRTRKDGIVCDGTSVTNFCPETMRFQPDREIDRYRGSSEEHT
jgi:hypothetical protein